ncbi:Aldo/keto reductase [Nemania sp. NC0429]|nr:Aldo/keto reductase [Nemania sp. NC0429]
MAPPKIILGSGVWGYFVDEDEILRQLAEAVRNGVHEIDSGAHHPYSRPGLAESMLRKIGFKKQSFIVDSKALFTNGGNGCLTAEAVKSSIDTTVASLKTQQVATYLLRYALAPDRATPLDEQVAAFDAQYRVGKFAELGLCNLQPEMLQDWVKTAEDKGCSAEDLKGTRFEVSDTNAIGTFLRKCYDKPAFHSAVRQMETLCEAHGIPIADAALRWLMHHSLLDGDKGDGVIIGPRNMQQLKQNIKACQDGPLPPELADGLAGLFAGVKDEAAEILVY